MSHNFQKSIDFLLENACVGIRYLVHRDLLKTPADDPLMGKMYGEVLLQSNVLAHFSAQDPDGWFGHELHGGDSVVGGQLGGYADSGKGDCAFLRTSFGGSGLSVG